MAALRIRGLTRRFGKVVAVDDLSFGVERGQIFGLLGPNGSGKSTTLACALGLMRPTSGEIEILGHPARHIHRTRGRVATVFDEPMRVRGLTVRQQMAYTARLRGHSGGRGTAEALELVGCGHLLGRPVTGLSLGQCKRVAVAAALAGSPELLVLDEPLSGLDPVGVRDLLETLRRLAAAGVTVILSSHRLHELESLVSHVAMLLAGRLVCHGSLEELLGSRNRLRLVVGDAARARELLKGLAGVECLDGPGSVGGDRDPQGAARAGARQELQVDAGAHDAADLNRILVDGGVAVHGLWPVEVSLPALFDSFVAAADPEGAEA